MTNNHYGLVRNTRGEFMKGLGCLNIVDNDSKIFKNEEYINNVIMDLEKIERTIHKACIEDNAVKLTKGILLRANFKDKNIHSKSPLQLFKIGKKQEAFKLADLFFPEDRYLWYLIFIWYLKINGREHEINKVIEKMVEKKNITRNGWTGDAVNIIYKEIIDLDAENLTKIYFKYFCEVNSYSIYEFTDIFLKSELYEQAVVASNYLIKTALKDEEIYEKLLNKYPNVEFTKQDAKRSTDRVLNEVFLEITSEIIRECLRKGEIIRAERLAENISLDWAKVDALLKITSHYHSIGELEKAEITLREASKLAISIEDIKQRKKYAYQIADKWNRDNVVSINSEGEGDNQESDKFTKLINGYVLKRKTDKYMDSINKLIKEGKIEEAEKVLDILPYDYDNWEIVRLIQEKYILTGDFHSAIEVNEKYQYKISRLHGIMFVLEKVIKCGIDKEIALEIIEKNILESYKPCTRWNKCEELFRIAHIQGMHEYIAEAKKSAERGLKVLGTIKQGKSEFLKLAVKALAAADEYNKALELIENDKSESMRSYSYIELSKILTEKNEHALAYEVINRIKNNEHRSIALAEKALVHFKLKDEVNGLKELNSCYKLIREDKLIPNCYLKKLICEIEALRGNLDKSIEMIKGIIYMQDETIERILPYIKNEEILYELLRIANNIDIRVDACSYVNSHLLIGNSFRILGNIEMYDKIKLDMEDLIYIKKENIWKDRIFAYIIKSELFAGERDRFLKLAKEFSESFKGELYNIADVFKIVKDKAAFKEFICTVDFTIKEAYYICEIVASLYPEFSYKISELIYEM